MPTYAILGATGNTGLSILSLLSQSPSNKINAYCRSTSKLHKLAPDTSSKSNITIFPGDLSNTSLLTDCLRDTQAVFLVTAQAYNAPTSIAQTTAHALISALEPLRRKNQKLPKVVVLSSGAVDPNFSHQAPWLVHEIVRRACSHIYADLEAAEVYLRQQAEWLDVVFARPGVLTHDVRKGHELSLEVIVGPISFVDLAAGMIELADAEGEAWVGRGVAVKKARGAKMNVPWESMGFVVWGLVVHFFPTLAGWIGGVMRW